MHSSTHTSAAGARPWRGILRRHLGWLLLAKLAALALLWALFFSPAHRTSADSQATGAHLAVAPQEGSRD